MKTKLKLKLSAMVIAGAMVAFNAQGQTTHGAGAINTNCSVGTSGTNHTLIGCGAGQSNSGAGNTFTGYNSGNANTTGSSNTLFGTQAGLNNVTGDANSIFGYQAGNGVATNSYAQNSLFGYQAGFAITTGSNNVMAGFMAGYSNTTAGSSTFLGASSGYNNTTGTLNTYIGFEASYYNVTGFSNTMVGYKAGKGTSTANVNNANCFFGVEAGTGITTGSDNVFMGWQAGLGNTTASGNVFVGEAAAYATTTGGGNTCLGYFSGRTNTSGINNICIGNQADVSSTGLSNAIAIGYSAIVGASNTLMLGGTGGNQVSVGIGTATPGNLLEGILNQNARTAFEVENTTDGTGACSAVVLTGNAGNGAVLCVSSPSYTGVTGWGDALFLDAGTSISGGLILAAAGSTADINFYAGGRTSSDVAMTITDGTNVGIGTTSPSDKLTVAGNTVPSADNTYTCGKSGQRWSAVWAANGTIQTSDARMKENVQNLRYGLTEVLKLRPVTFNWKDNDAQKKIGLIAQEVQQIIPEMVVVGDDSENRLGINYAEFTPILINCIQKQQQMIDDLKTEVKDMKSEIQNCCTYNQSGSNNKNVQENTATIHDLELANNAVLYQNTPNPFGEGTTVKYFVPDNSNAQIIFYDEFGNEIKKVDVKEKGMGQLDIATSNLAAGLYSYSLLVNGKAVDTKKMVKSK